MDGVAPGPNIGGATTMYQHHFDRLFRLLASDIPRKYILEELGISDTKALVDDEAACHAMCNATVPPGPRLGLCHAECGLNAAQARASSIDISDDDSRQAACHAMCNATVPPGPALGACHVRCALGG